MNSRTVALILILDMVVGIVPGAEITTATEDKNVADKDLTTIAKVVLPSKDTAEYWIIRTQTMNEFIPFMTEKRTEFRKTFKLISDFLVKIGKAQDFVKDGVKAPDDPKLHMEVLGLANRIAQADVQLPQKRASWEGSVELAMKVIMIEGYLPTDVADSEEFLTIKRLCAQQEKYGRKVRNELHDLVQKCLNVWFYLDTIDKQGAFREYKYLEEEKERQEKEKALKERHEQLRALASRRGDSLKAMRRYDSRYRRNRFTYGYGRYGW